MSSYNKIVWMAIPFAVILQDGDLPVHSLGVYMHFNGIVFYAPSERIEDLQWRHAMTSSMDVRHIGGIFGRFLTLFPLKHPVRRQKIHPIWRQPSVTSLITSRASPLFALKGLSEWDSQSMDWWLTHPVHLVKITVPWKTCIE
jgi:hypothetical protein